MEFGIRTAFRHFGIAGLLVGTLLTAFGSDAVLFWLRSNLVFFGSWLVLIIGLGFFADTAVRWEWFDRLLKIPPENDPPSQRSPSRLRRLFGQWSSCSRCVGYWGGGMFSFAAAAVYFPSWFPGSLFFMFLGASLATGISVSAYLWRTRSGEHE